MIKLLFPPNGLVFDTYTDIQNDFVEKIYKDGTEKALDWLKAVKDNKERTYPNTITFTWKSDDPSEYVLELSENQYFTDSIKYHTKFESLEVGNLKTGVKYFWRVNSSKPNNFFTKPHFTRFIFLDGALNVRDIGGYKIKQGLFFRGSALDPPFCLTNKGVFSFVNELKVKTEVELRKDAIVNTKKCIWSNLVDRVHFPYRPYLEVFEDEHVLNIRRIMNFLSEESVYPVYMHCHGGADRTGMIAFFLRALLGEEDEIILIDYELTSLSTYAFGIEEGAEGTGFRSRYYPYYRNFIDKLQEYAPNKPLSVCVYNFLLSCGVEEECIDKIRNILRKQ